ncbi:hypothetical protein U9M48_004724, partial [Paspalum notatum var. saurae]
DEDTNPILDPEDIIADPGMRKPIEEMHPNVRDDAKREYVLLGPCQPKETTKAIIQDIGDSQFAVLVDESRDASIKEQMAVILRLLGQTNDLSQCLQRKDQNIVRAVGLIAITLEKINEIREHGWEELYDGVNKFCVEHHINIPNMGDTVTVRGRSRGRGGQQVTYHHHFKNEIFNVVHDQIIVELNNRFAERSTELLRCIACLDPRNSFEAFDVEKLVQLAKIYDSDFSHYECGVLRVQLGNFISDVRADPSFISCMLAVKMVQSRRHTAFSLVYRLVVLALILPVATATVERAFSAMKIIKTELRNKMGDEWLNHRMVCYIERGVFASIKNDDIVKRFQELKTRRKKLPKLLGAVVNENEDVGASNAPNLH